MYHENSHNTVYSALELAGFGIQPWGVIFIGLPVA